MIFQNPVSTSHPPLTSHPEIFKLYSFLTLFVFFLCPDPLNPSLFSRCLNWLLVEKLFLKLTILLLVAYYSRYCYCYFCNMAALFAKVFDFFWALIKLFWLSIWYPKDEWLGLARMKQLFVETAILLTLFMVIISGENLH